MAEHAIGNAHIGAFAEQVHYVGTRFAQQKAKQHRHQNASGENIQRWIRLSGDHPVINLHRKDNPGERQNVNQKGGNHDRQVRADVL